MRRIAAAGINTLPAKIAAVHTFRVPSVRSLMFNTPTTGSTKATAHSSRRHCNHQKPDLPSQRRSTAARRPTASRPTRPRSTPASERSRRASAIAAVRNSIPPAKIGRPAASSVNTREASGSASKRNSESDTGMRSPRCSEHRFHRQSIAFDRDALARPQPFKERGRLIARVGAVVIALVGTERCFRDGRLRLRRRFDVGLQIAHGELADAPHRLG